jgi:hypothetical protein
MVVKTVTPRRVLLPAIHNEPIPIGISLGIGAILMIVAGLMAAPISSTRPDARFAVIAIAVALFAALTIDPVALGPVALIGFLIDNGFLEDRYGELSWHGSVDLWHLLALVIVGALGLATGEAIRWMHALRKRGEHGG